MVRLHGICRSKNQWPVCLTINGQVQFNSDQAFAVLGTPIASVINSSCSILWDFFEPVEKVKKANLYRKRVIAKNKLEDAKEKYQNAKTRFKEANEKYRDHKEKLNEAKKRYRECVNDEECEVNEEEVLYFSIINIKTPINPRIVKQEYREVSGTAAGRPERP